MKLSVIVLLSAILNWQAAHANVAFDVFGKLVISEQSAEINSSAGTIKLHGLKSELKSCNDGVFTIVSNYVPRGTYTLLEVVKCNDASARVESNNNKVFEPIIKDEIVYCPEIYAPVCGRPLKGEFGDAGAPRTYSNSCFMKVAGAVKIMDGECSDRLRDMGTEAVALRILRNLPY